MNTNVHNRFLMEVNLVMILLFEGEVFSLEEHVEYLVSERVVVNWHCYEQDHDD